MNLRTTLYLLTKFRARSCRLALDVFIKPNVLKNVLVLSLADVISLE